MVFDFMSTKLNLIIKLFSQTKIQILIISLLTILAYSNILQNGLSFDDRDFFLNWPAVKDSASGLSSFLNLPDLLAGDLPANHRGVYRPIRSLYYLFSFKLWGFNPFMFHLQGLLTHLLVSITIYFIVALISKKSQSKNNLLPFLTASLFAIHPVHTEAVSYTAASFDSLGILFFFSSFYFYLRADVIKANKQATRLLSWLLAFLSFFTYEMCLMLPVLIITYEVLTKKLSLKNLTTRLNIHLPYFIILGSYGVVRMLFFKIGTRADYLGMGYLAASNQAKVGTLEVLFTYLRLFFLPTNLTISYPVPETSFMLFYRTAKYLDPSQTILKVTSDFAYLIPITILAALIFLIFKFLRKNFLVTFSLLWFLISLTPIINIIPQGSVITERYLYIPSFGLSLLTAIFLIKFFSSKFYLSAKFSVLINLFLIFILFVMLILTTYTRNKDWHDLHSIFLSAIRNNPSDFLANGAMGSILLEEKNYDASLKHSQIALTTDPTAFQIRYQIALAYEGKDDLERAITEHNKTLESEPKFFYSNLGLGNIYKKQGKFNQAISEYEKVLSADPNNFDALYNLAGIYVQKEDWNKTIEYYQKALKQRPEESIIFGNLGFCYEKLGNINQAIFQYQKALELKPDNYYFLVNLGSLYEKQNNLPLALEKYNQALKIKPDDINLKNKIIELED